MLKLSKKHIFLYRIHCELEAREKKGEEIPFNYECSSRLLAQLKFPQEKGTTESFTSISCVTRRENSVQHTTITSTHLSLIPDKKKPFVLIEREQTVVEQDADSDYIEDEDVEEHNVEDEDEVAEEYDEGEDGNLHKRPRRSTRSNRQTPRTPPSPLVEKKKSYSRKQFQQQDVSKGEQTECCLEGCTNSVTNRLRFSLRCHKTEDFKPSFLNAGWNKVCHYHYFSDLYKFKKNNRTKPNSKKKPKKSPNKRKRSDEEDSADEENMDPQVQNDDEDDAPSPKRIKQAVDSSLQSSLLQETSA